MGRRVRAPRNRKMNTTTTSDLVAITGNTYPVKEQLKALGARWNADAKAWMVAPDKAEQAKAIVSGGSASKTTTTFRPRKCSCCGITPQVDRRGFVQYGTKILTTRFGVLCGDCYEEAKMGY